MSGRASLLAACAVALLLAPPPPAAGAPFRLVASVGGETTVVSGGDAGRVLVLQPQPSVVVHCSPHPDLVCESRVRGNQVFINVFHRVGVIYNTHSSTESGDRSDPPEDHGPETSLETSEGDAGDETLSAEPRDEAENKDREENEEEKLGDEGASNTENDDGGSEENASKNEIDDGDDDDNSKVSEKPGRLSKGSHDISWNWFSSFKHPENDDDEDANNVPVKKGSDEDVRDSNEPNNIEGDEGESNHEIEDTYKNESGEIEEVAEEKGNENLGSDEHQRESQEEERQLVKDDTSGGDTDVSEDNDYSFTRKEDISKEQVEAVETTTRRELLVGKWWPLG